MELRSTFTIFFLLLFALITSSPGVAGEVNDGEPLEAQCRPYIEEALKKLETGDTPPDSEIVDVPVDESKTIDESIESQNDSAQTEDTQDTQASEEQKSNEDDATSQETETITDEQTKDDVSLEHAESRETETQDEKIEEKSGETTEQQDATSTEKVAEETVLTEETTSSEKQEESSETDKSAEVLPESGENINEATQSGENLSEENKSVEEENKSVEEEHKSVEQDQVEGTSQEVSSETKPEVEPEEKTSAEQQDNVSVEKTSAEQQDNMSGEQKSIEDTASAEETSTEKDKTSQQVSGEDNKSQEEVTDNVSTEKQSTESKEDGEQSAEQKIETSTEVQDESKEQSTETATESKEEIGSKEETDKSVEKEDSKEVKDDESKEVKDGESQEESNLSQEEVEKSSEIQEGASEERRDEGASDEKKNEGVSEENKEEVESQEQKQSVEESNEVVDATQQQSQEEQTISSEQTDISVEKSDVSTEQTDVPAEEVKSEEVVSKEEIPVQESEVEPAVESSEAASEEVAETQSEETNASAESLPEEDLMQPFDIPTNLRSRSHISQILHLDDENNQVEKVITKASDVILKELKRIYEGAIKPLETLYKYRDLSNRHFGDPEIFSKPLVLFMGPWSGGKSSIINYLLDNEYTATSLRTGAEPSPAYFNILMWGEKPELLDGTQLAADWTFSGLQKFGQGLEERLSGLKLPSKILEKVNIVEIPGILEVRKQVSRVFPFNDACQWFIDRADIIFLVYDPSKLDVGPETEAILDQLKGREYQTRILLNKADQVKSEELMRVQGALIWNISPLMSSAQPPVMYLTSLWSRPYEDGAPVRLLQAQERAFLRDIKSAVDKRIENKISSARRFAVRVRNHAKMVDCYLTTYYNHKSVFANKKLVSDQIIEHPQDYHIYEGLSTLTNISRYDLPDPDVYRDFFRLNPLYEFQQLSATCTYFRGCPINRLDVAIAYDFPELVGKYKKMVEQATSNIS